MFWVKKIWVEKNFGLKKVGLDIFLGTKNQGRKEFWVKNLGRKIFWVKKIWLDNFLGQKKTDSEIFLGQKNQGRKFFWVPKNVCRKKF